MKNKNLVYTFKGVIYKAQQGTKTVNLHVQDGDTAFTCFVVNENIDYYEDLERAVIEWNAINNLYGKVSEWIELKELESFFNDDINYIDELESLSGFRELFILATITDIKQVGQTLRFYDNLHRYFSLDKNCSIVG